jgi:hypothetical protein
MAWSQYILKHVRHKHATGRDILTSESRRSIHEHQDFGGLVHGEHKVGAALSRLGKLVVSDRDHFVASRDLRSPTRELRPSSMGRTGQGKGRRNGETKAEVQAVRRPATSITSHVIRAEVTPAHSSSC